MLLVALSCAAALRPLTSSTTSRQASDALTRHTTKTHTLKPHTHAPPHQLSYHLSQPDVDGEVRALTKDTHTIGSSRRAASGANVGTLVERASFAAAAALVHLALAGGVTPVAHAESPPSSSSPAATIKTYDGFAEYAADGNKMEQTDVNCLTSPTQCKDQTFACFSGQPSLGGTGDLSCLKGVVCLGRCQGEQLCATQCFAQYGSKQLDNWLSCAIEDEQCVKVPRDVDFSQINANPPPIDSKFDAAAAATSGPAVAADRAAGSWFKTLGLNPKYDLYDCQRNTFERDGPDTMSIDIEFRVPRPNAPPALAWPNRFSERLVIDAPRNALGRSFHTEGKMFGLSFAENWYVLGGSTDEVNPFWVAAYKGHTLQGNYDGAFVFSKTPTFPEAARPALDKVLAAAGYSSSDFAPIDNSCPELSGKSSRQTSAGLSDLYDLVEWVRPGTIFKYDK